MSLTDGKSWSEENQARARRLAAICSLVAFGFAVILFFSEIKGFFSSHRWWEDTLVVLGGIAGIAVPVLAFFELRHSGEANELRRQANEYRAEANRLQERIGELSAENSSHLAHIAELEKERNEHLKQIAENTQRPQTQADINAEIFRKYLRKKVSVSEGKNNWNEAPEIVDVTNNIVTLFTAKSYNCSNAWSVQVHCNDAEITEIPHGSCALRVRINKRYGAEVQLGETTRWEDRFQPSAAPVFAKGDCVGYATFVKPGSPEKRSLYVYVSKDGANSFLPEASTGERPTGDNVEISRRFVVMYVEYLAAGFTRSTGGSGSSQQYRLFLPQYYSTRKGQQRKFFFCHIAAMPVQNAPGRRSTIDMPCVRFVYVISHECPEINSASQEFNPKAIADRIA